MNFVVTFEVVSWIMFSCYILYCMCTQAYFVPSHARVMGQITSRNLPVQVFPKQIVVVVQFKQHLAWYLWWS